MPTAHSARVLLSLLFAALLAPLLLVAGAGTAHAADGYKYWNYFHVTDGKYEFAQTGPGGYKPADGAVEAYRYGLSTVATGLQPRTEATTYSVDDICADEKAGTGEKRVGVIVDYGTTADAPKGSTPPEPRAACAVVPANANGQQVLDAATDVRVEKQVVCGIDGFPASTCSVTVKNPPKAAPEEAVDFALPSNAADDGKDAAKSSSDSASEDEGGVSWPLVGAAVAVVILGGGAFALSRRNKNA